MSLLLKLAWRNIFRNVRRTTLSVLVISIGLTALIFMDALMIGMSQTMIRTATSTFLGQAQIHAPGFQKDPSVENTIPHPARLLEQLKADPHITEIGSRISVFAMVSSATNNESVLLYGIEPAPERELTKIDDSLIEGGYLNDDAMGILIGHRLAKKLELGIGDRVVVTLAQAHTGDLSQALFRVQGIYRFHSRQMDASMAFIPLEEAQKLLSLQGQFHEIALRLTNADLSPESLRAPYAEAGIELERWDELMPDLKSVLEMSNYSIFIMGGLLFAIILVGILNTLFMSIYERMFEFGVVKAIGTRPGQLALLVLLEAGSLGVLGALIGIVLGATVTGYFANYGLSFGNLEYASIALSEPIFPQLRLHQFVLLPIVVIGLTLLSGVYPAIYAARINPATAMRKSL